jgi:hypothetical protein
MEIKGGAEFNFIIGNKYNWTFSLNQNPINTGLQMGVCKAFLGVSPTTPNNYSRWYIGDTYTNITIIEDGVLYEIYPIEIPGLSNSNTHIVFYSSESACFSLNIPNGPCNANTQGAIYELGLEVDYDTYIQFGGDENAETMITERLLARLDKVFSFYKSYFDICFDVRGPYFRKSNDKFFGPSALNSIRDNWNFNRACIPVDGIIMVNTGNNLPSAGQTNGNFTDPCNFDDSTTPLTSYVDWQLPMDFSPDDDFNDYFTQIMAHELGHQLTGRNHIDDSDYCGSGFALCTATGQSCKPLMCAGGGGGDFYSNNLSSCSINEIQNRLDTRSCYQDYRPYPPNLPCPECDHELSLTPDQDYMVLNCGEETTTVNYTFDFCNYCALGEFDFTINLRNFSNINFIAPPDAPFTVTQGPFDTGILTIEDVNLDVEECFSFEYALEYLAPNLYDSYTALISVDSTHLDSNSTQHLEEDTFILNFPANTFYSDAADDAEFEPINGRLSYLIGAGLMPPAGSTGEQIRRRVIDDLIIDMDNISGADQYSITNTASILLMEPGTRIIVESGTLELRNTRIRGCDGMWGSIQVEDGAELIAQRCDIRDGTTAIKLGNGARASITNCYFLNNNVGVSLDNKYYTNTADLYRFYGNDFRGEGYLKAPLQDTRSAFGVRINKGAVILGDLNKSPNRFDGLQNGIYASRATLSVRNSSFTNITAPPPNEPSAFPFAGRAVGVRGASVYNANIFMSGMGETLYFENCDHAVDIEQSSAWIRSLSINNCDVGIRAANCDQRFLRIFNNYDMAVNQTGIELVQNNPLHAWIGDNRINFGAEAGGELTGILVDESAFASATDFGRYNIAQNQVTLPGNGTGILLGTGRYIDLKENVVRLEGNNANQTGIQLEGTENAWLRCNTVEGPANFGPNTIGIDGFGAAGTWLDCNQTNNTFRGFRFNGMGDAVQFRGNTMGDHFHGLLLNEDGVIGQQNYHNNYWCGSYMDSENGVEVGARHLGIQEFVAQSPFFIDPSLIDQGNCAVLPGRAAAGDWFFDFPLGAEDSNYFCSTPNFDACSNNAPDSPTPQEEDEDILLRKLANGTFQASRYQSALKYTGQRHLYKRLEQQSTPLSNWKLSFLNQAGSTPVGEYNSIDQSIKEALTLPDTIAQSLAAQDSSLMEVMDELSGIDAALSAEPPTDTAELLLKRREMLASLALQDSIAGNLRAAVQKEQQETLSLIEAANQNAPADSLYEANEQAFNTLAIKAAASIDSLSGSELSALFSLANQCPLSGGDAVFRARSLYRLADPTHRFDNAALCQPNAALRAPEAAAPLDFKLFPNPTSGLTVLEFSTSIAGSVNVTLYSLQGQPVLQQTAGEGAQHILLETAALPDGTYFCRVTGVDGSTGVKKLVKL